MRTWQTWSAAPRGTTSTTRRSARSSPRSGRRPASPPSAPRCSGPRCTAPSATTGFPFTRWLRRLRPDPLRRLHLDRARTTAITAGADDADLVPTSQRTSLPATGAVERSRVELALRRLGDDAAAGLPDPWPDALRDAARSRAGDLADSLDRAVAATDLGLSRKPLWWRAFGLLQVLLAATAIAGALWLAGLYALTVLRLPEPEPPQVGIVPLPTVLLIGGLLAGVVLALLARALAVRAPAGAGHARRPGYGSRWPTSRRTWCWARCGPSWPRTRRCAGP